MLVLYIALAAFLIGSLILGFANRVPSRRPTRRY